MGPRGPCSSPPSGTSAFSPEASGLQTRERNHVEETCPSHLPRLQRHTPLPRTACRGEQGPARGKDAGAPGGGMGEMTRSGGTASVSLPLSPRPTEGVGRPVPNAASF